MDIHIRSRGRLPHWESADATYFVTFRLADSLPRAVLEQLESERFHLLARIKQAGREPTSDERLQIAELFSQKVEEALDRGSGSCALANKQIGQVVADALLHFHNVRYDMNAYVVMPNHVHIVVKPQNGYSLQQLLHSWKSYTSNQANKLLGNSGEFWEREYYDHLVRSEGDLERVIAYVLENPAKAGLADWPWVGRLP